MLDPFFAWLRGIHDRHARVILASIATLMLPLMIMTTVATMDNWRQDKDRDALLACINDYADASSTSSKAVRVASAKKDVATADFNLALNAEGAAFKRLIGAILAENVKPADVQRLYDTLDERDRAGRALVAAQDELNEARRENPVPDPPSEFCGYGDDPQPTKPTPTFN